MDSKSTAITLFNERNNLENNNHITRSANAIFPKELRKNNKNTVIKYEILQEAFQPVLLIAQCIGILPIYGIFAQTSQKLQFRWFSLKVIIAMIMAICGCILLTFTAANQGITGRSVGSLVFYLVTTLSMLFYIQFAREWKGLITQWKKVIDEMEINGKEIIKKTKMITILMLILSLGEHTLANLDSYFLEYGIGKTFFEHKFKNVFSLTEYTLWKAILVVIIHFQNTIVWNFNDILIINVATITSLQFKYFNKGVHTAIKQESPIIIWKEKREIYCHLSSIMKRIDDKISSVVLLSFGSNLFFICKQLYYSLRPRESLLKNIYFYLSFGFVLIRTCWVCFSAANIYENSKKPLHILYSIPSEQYNVEIQRLFDTINTETLALSGYNFFTLNRKLILTVAGTIATYEIVLLQYDALAFDD